MTVVTATISGTNGAAMDPTWELMSIDIEREVGRVPRCSLRLLDGDLATSTFPISDTEFFAPGAELTVKLRYEGKGEPDAQVFRGLVVRHGLELTRRGTILHVELKDRAVALTGPRNSAVHVDASDAEVIDKLATAAGLVAAGDPVQTSPTHAQLVQYRASDWDFILARAEAQGLVFAVTDGAYTLAAPVPSKEPVRSFEFAVHELFEVELEADGLSQLPGVQGLAWDMQAKTATAAATAVAVKNPAGDLDGAAVASALGFGETILSSAVPLDPGELQAWADGRLARSRMAMIRGRISARGSAELKLLDPVKLVGMGARFAGTTVVTGIRHRVTTGGWVTDLQLGFSPELQAARPGVAEAPAAGLLPPVSGLQVGVVAPFAADPLKAHRVKVILPGIHATEGAVWARLALPDAGPGRGCCFRPEEGDEVVVGFFNDDPRQPVILGAMFGATNKPPADLGEPKADNLLKGIFSRTGVKIAVVDDKKPKVSIETPAGHKLVLDDNHELVLLADKAGNTITLSADGVEIKSAKDLTLDASGGEVVLKGKKVDVL